MAVFEEETARRNLEMRNIFLKEERVKELALFEAVQFLATEKNRKEPKRTKENQREPKRTKKNQKRSKKNQKRTKMNQKEHKRKIK